MKTTRTHFKYFNQQVLQWVNFFGLSSSWEVSTHHVDLPDKNMAETTCDYPAKMATIYLGKEWPDMKVTEEELDKTAFHEVCELILDLLDTMAKISVKHDAVDTARHTIIQTLTSAVWEPTTR